MQLVARSAARSQVCATGRCPALRRLIVGNVRVFGSVARGEVRADSDLDLLIDVPADLGLLGLGRLADELEALLGARVDLVPSSDLEPGVRARVEADLVSL